MGLEGTVLREISQTEKDKHRTTSLVCGIEETQAHRQGQQSGGCRRRGKVDQGCGFQLSGLQM